MHATGCTTIAEIVEWDLAQKAVPKLYPGGAGEERGSIKRL